MVETSGAHNLRCEKGRSNSGIPVVRLCLALLSVLVGLFRVPRPGWIALLAAVALLMGCAGSAFALGYDEFELFWVGADGLKVFLRLARERDGSPKLDDAGGIVEIQGDFGGEALTSKSKGPLRASGCRLSFKPGELECGENGGPLRNTRHSVSPETARLPAGSAPPAEAEALLQKYLSLRRYGSLGMFLLCTRGCNKDVPDRIILVWRGD